jgi:hypothetical protein
MGQFSIGAYYMEYITTGRLTIGKDGGPVTSPVERGQVYYFITQEAVEKVKALTPVAPENIRANTAYLRLFQAPEQIFDGDGELVRPRFSALGLFELHEVSAFSDGHLQDFCPSLREAVLPFFKDVERAV